MRSAILGRVRSLVDPSYRRGIDIGARRAEQSVISTVHDLEPGPSRPLIDLAVRSVQASMDADTDEIERRCSTEDDRTWVRTWPGEHYRLLIGICRTLEPHLAIEIGTFTGLGALALSQACPQVVTFDLVPWDAFDSTVLRPADFDSGKIAQRLGDLSKADEFEANRELLEAADLIFVDGPKDAGFEQSFVRLLEPLVRSTGALLVFDDIRVMPMIRFWRDLPMPKLDLTSFGHWSGTGLAGFIEPA